MLEGPRLLLPIAVNAWLLIVLGWPFYFFENDWADLWGGTKAGIFIGNLVLFSFETRLIAQAFLPPGLFAFPWYLALVLVLYPTVVVGYLAPERSAVVAVIAFISGWPLSWSWLRYVSHRKPWLWKCTRCGYRMATATDESPPTLVSRKRCRSPQGQHNWTLVGPNE
jgi:hypothetical protein